MIKLYQAEWCPFSHRIRVKLTELGVDYEVVNVSASAEKRAELKEITGNSTIPVLADGEKVFPDSSLGAATLALLKVAVYEEDGVTRIDAIEHEKASEQVRKS
jgi:glutathione S-transferase